MLIYKKESLLIERPYEEDQEALSGVIEDVIKKLKDNGLLTFVMFADTVKYE